MTGTDAYGDGAAVGARIGQARRELGLTQAELATRIGVTLAVLDRYETGRADPSGKLAEIAEVTGRRVSWFTSTPYDGDAEAYETELRTQLESRIAESVGRLGSASHTALERRLAAGVERRSGLELEDAMAGLRPPNLAEPPEDPSAIARHSELQAALAEEQRKHEETTARAGRLAEELERANANVKALSGQLEQSRSELADARTHEDELAGRVSELEGGLRLAEELAAEARRGLSRAETELQVFRTRERSLVKELDLREAELNVRAAELDTRETAVAHAELSVGARAAEVDKRQTAVTAAEASVEDRLRALGEVEARVAAADARERALGEREEELEQRAEVLTGLTRRLDALRHGEGVEEVRRPAREDQHLVVASNHGYRFVARQGAVPEPGAIIELEDGLHRCLRVGASPFSGDDRLCAVLEPLTGGTEPDTSPEPPVE
jgi:ribosome-binding protein aMBF1 (putative translation factor)